ncbi:hypothetical protein GYMLUDRAFT_87455 [Collybiopsis luxurians FD-317 M1]|uniref:Uncharacterized protein n=1 Tax=Collybiopsis luxurians FD-317 M1 TaxID=944289 RepID=A0A0D0CD49_9AGAR|nr:hypothetical protein GYMLUDRAFT_87455 [Collybiopsis luxurians FD-317 M1]
MSQSISASSPVLSQLLTSTDLPGTTTVSIDDNPGPSANFSPGSTSSPSPSVTAVTSIAPQPGPIAFPNTSISGPIASNTGLESPASSSSSTGTRSLQFLSTTLNNTSQSLSSSSFTTSTFNGNNKSSVVPVIAGGVVGSVAVLAIVILTIIFLLHRRGRARSRSMQRGVITPLTEGTESIFPTNEPVESTGNTGSIIRQEKGSRPAASHRISHLPEPPLLLGDATDSTIVQDRWDLNESEMNWEGGPKILRVYAPQYEQDNIDQLASWHPKDPNDIVPPSARFLSLFLSSVHDNAASAFDLAFSSPSPFIAVVLDSRWLITVHISILSKLFTLIETSHNKLINIRQTSMMLVLGLNSASLPLTYAATPILSSHPDECYQMKTKSYDATSNSSAQSSRTGGTG